MYLVCVIFDFYHGLKMSFFIKIKRNEDYYFYLKIEELPKLGTIRHAVRCKTNASV